MQTLRMLMRPTRAYMAWGNAIFIYKIRSMQLRPVKTPDDPALSFIKLLYEDAFPFSERRLHSQFMALLEEPAMELALVEDEGQAIGFVIWWQLGEWHFVEHIAVDPAQRGRQYGAKVMKLLLELSGNRLVLECEREHDVDSGRRVRFYERLGFVAMPVVYVQPPYRYGESTVPMLLMSIPAIDVEEVALSIAETIKKAVYEQYY